MRKNWKILLPVCTLAATASALVPCLTSCGSNDGWGKAINLEDYNPDETTRREAETGGTLLTVAANSLFGSNAKALVEQDILTCFKNVSDSNWTSFIKTNFLVANETIIINKKLCSISGLKIKHETDDTFAKISGTIKLKFDCDLYYETDPGIRLGTYTIETKHKICDLPYYLISTSANEYNWWVQCDATDGELSSLASNREWYVDSYYSSDSSYIDDQRIDLHQSESIVYNCLNISKIQTGSFKEQLFKLVYWTHSFYLELCEYKPA